MYITSLQRLAIVTPFYIGSAFILFLPITPGIASLSAIDGWIHIALFFTLAAVTFFIYPTAVRAGAWSLVIYAAYSEILQSLTPTRTPDMADLFHDCIGIAIALILFALILRTKKQIPRVVSKQTKRKKRIKQ